MPSKAFGENFEFSSCTSSDTWHSKKPSRAYEWWYFDALSDDGNEAVVIVFLDNFIYSPRYNEVSGSTDGKDANEARARFPAVSFTYFSGGKQVYRAVNEYQGHDFFASETVPKCIIGGSGFHFESAPYGSGFSVSVNLPLSRGRQLYAEFEWLSIESDLLPAEPRQHEKTHCWNMVAARSDVSGKIRVNGPRGKATDVRTFRGTGYHDHNLDNRWLANTVKEWHWGRAHFADLTAIFCRYSEIGEPDPRTSLLLVRNGVLSSIPAAFEEQDHVRDRFGVRYPTCLRLVGDGGEDFQVHPTKVIDSSFYHLRFLSSVTLSLPGEPVHSTAGITEFIAPRALKYRWLNLLSDLRTGKNGKGPLI